jgi:hypothetical protein
MKRAERDIEMTDEAYLKALLRLRERIEKCNLVYFDDDTIGSKDTQCTWGLCCASKEQWPDPEDHLWPDQFIKEGRVAPKYRKPYQVCPMDTRPVPNREAPRRNGCFYTCLFFQKGANPTCKDALELVDNIITRVEAENED